MNDERDYAAPDVDIRTEVTQFAQMLAADEKFAYAFQQLVKVGCHEVNLAWLISKLWSANFKTRLSRKELETIAEDLNASSKSLSTLSFSQFATELGITNDRLRGEISELVAKIAALAPKVEKRSALEKDLVRAAIVHFVQASTGKLFDADVAAIIGVTESTPLDSRFAGPDPNAKNYSEEAHVQWRNRAGRRFLEGPSEEVVELLKEMERM